MADECIFCRIAAGRVEAHIIHEDDLVVAFLDRWPIRAGHTQIAPKQHAHYFEDVPPMTMAAITAVGQKLARRMKQLYEVPRVAFLFTGGDIAHAHAHVLPMHHKTDITSARYIAETDLTFRSTPQMPDAELAKVAISLRT